MSLRLVALALVVFVAGCNGPAAGPAAPSGLDLVGTVAEPGGMKEMAGVAFSAATGGVLAGAEVSIESTTRSEPATRTTTGPDGAFSATVAPGSYIVAVSQPEHSTTRQSVPAPRTGLDFRLEREAIVRGALITVDGSPIVRGSILITTIHARNFNRVTKNREPVRDFVVDGLMPGKTTMVAKAEGMAPAIARFELQAGQTVEGAVIALQREAGIAGRVIDGSGSPIRGANLLVAYELPVTDRELLEPQVGGFLKTGADGVFRITKVVPDTWVILGVEIDGRTTRFAPLRLSPGQVLDQELMVERP